MDFSEYQDRARDTAVYPVIGKQYVYPTLGLVNEAGEVAGKVKKIFRDDQGEMSAKKREEIMHELGDVLWYLSQLATDLGLRLHDIAVANLERLALRKQHGTISGSGDNR